MSQFNRDPADHVYRVAGFEPFEWLEHGFSTRQTTGWPDLSRLVTAKQVHSATVLMISDEPGQIGTGDAILSDLPGRLAGVRTADCLPILIVDPAHRAVAAVHAGWRGGAQEIVRCTISEMVGRFGTTPSDLRAAIGPAIGECCYEVGMEVARQFQRWLPEIGAAQGKVRLDLAKAVRRQFVDSGVAAEHIFSGAPCTFCTEGEFHSFRRDGDAAGRMVACIGIRDK